MNVIALKVYQDVTSAACEFVSHRHEIMGARLKSFLSSLPLSLVDTNQK